MRAAPCSISETSCARRVSSSFSETADSSTSSTKILPALGRNRPPSRLDQRRLAGPGRPEQADHLPGARPSGPPRTGRRRRAPRTGRCAPARRVLMVAPRLATTAFTSTPVPARERPGGRAPGRSAARRRSSRTAAMRAATAAAPQLVVRSRVETAGSAANSGTDGIARCAPTRPQAPPATTASSTTGQLLAGGDPHHRRPRRRRSSAARRSPGTSAARSSRRTTSSTSTAMAQAGTADDQREGEAPGGDRGVELVPHAGHRGRGGDLDVAFAQRVR